MNILINTTVKDFFRQVNLETFTNSIIEKSTTILGKLIAAILLLWVGLKIIKAAIKFTRRFFERHNLEASAATFLLSCINIGLKTALFLSCGSVLGINLTAFLTLLGSAGVAIGLALQGSLSNIAGGILILTMKPFKVGDYIKEDGKGNEGTVVSIDIFYTRLQTSDNKMVLIPNGVLTNSSLTNVTEEDKRRLDIFVGIEYSEDLNQVKALLWKLLKEDEHLLQEEDMLVYVNDFEDSAISIGIRAWAPMDTYWQTRYAMLEKIKLAFDENGVVIPGNKLEVSILNEK